MHCAWDTPAADAEPVRHAEWEWFDELNGNPLEGQDRDWGWRCSGCKTELPDDYNDPDCKPNIKYCSECGAEMDGGAVQYKREIGKAWVTEKTNANADAEAEEKAVEK